MFKPHDWKSMIEYVYDGNYVPTFKGLGYLTRFEEIGHKETEILEKKSVVAAILEANRDAEPF